MLHSSNVNVYGFASTISFNRKQYEQILGYRDLRLLWLFLHVSIYMNKLKIMYSG